MTSFRLPSFALVALSLITIVMGTSCLNDDNLIPPNCFDGLLNNGEELVDCGGPICEPCDPCENGVWDQVLGEQWVDCGGECAPCDVGFNGQLDPGETGIDCGGDTGIDCGELCGDGLLNGNEIDVDCGGPDCEACPSCEDELLNGEIFYSLAEAKVIIEAWRRYYNTERPHSSLGYKPPAPEAIIWPAPPRGSTPPSAQAMAAKPIMH